MALAYVILFAILGFSLSVVAEEKSPELTTIEKRLVRGNRTMSEHFDQVAENIDAYLVGRKGAKLYNRTRVVLENSTISREGKGVNNSSDVNLDLHLPNLEEHWALKFTSYDENEELRGTRERYLRKTPRERSYGTTIAVAKKLGKVRARFQPRIAISDPLKISHLLRFESEADMKTYVINPKVEFFARPGKGTGVFGGLNFDFRIDDHFVFSLINGHEYQEFFNLFTSSNGFSLGQSVSESKSISYSLLFYSSSRMRYHLDNYTVSTSWSHLLYKNVIHYQIIPHLDFAKTRSFKGMAGIVLSIQFIF